MTTPRPATITATASTNTTTTTVAPCCLLLGALLGLVGSVVPSTPLRSLAWGLDGTLLVVAAALLAVHCLRRQQELLAAGFLVFIAGQTLVVAGSAMTLPASRPLFAAGAALWAAALLMISGPRLLPSLARAAGTVTALLFAATALQIFAGATLTPLSRPLPFLAYPVFVLTLASWAHWCRRQGPQRP